SIDENGKQVTYRTAAGISTTIKYDRLVLAAGSRLNRPQMQGIEHVFDVDQIEDAARLEAHIRALKNLPDSPARNTVVVAGGGVTGIEPSTEMPARLREALGDNGNIRVVLVDRGPQIPASMGDGIRPSIIEASKELGLEW